MLLTDHYFSIVGCIFCENIIILSEDNQHLCVVNVAVTVLGEVETCSFGRDFLMLLKGLCHG